MDESNDPEDKYDRGAPDYMADYGEEEREVKNTIGRTVGKKMYNREKGLKHKIICLGVDNLIKQEELDEDNVMIWVDWQSVRRRRGTRTPSTLRPDSPWPQPDRAGPTPPTRRRFRRTTRTRSSPACAA